MADSKHVGFVENVHVSFPIFPEVASMTGKKNFKRTRPGRYERSEPDVLNDEPSDEKERVRIYVRAIDIANNSVKRGTISRSFTVRDAKVSEVADAVERALFGG